MRIAAQIGMSYLALLLFGAAWRLMPLSQFTPDFVNLVAAYLGLTARNRLAPSVAGAVTIGYLADLLYGTPVGMLAVTAGLVCSFCHLIQGRLLVRGPVFTMVFAALISLVAGVFVLWVRGRAGLLPIGVIAELSSILVTALITGLLGPFVFRSCRFVDSRFAHTRRERDAAATGAIL